MAGTITVTVTERISLGGTNYKYLGSLKPDTSYVAGGDTLVQPTSGYTLPGVIKSFQLGESGGLNAEYVPGATPKVKLFLGAESGSGLKGAKEAGEGTDYSALSFPFEVIGA